MAHQGHKSTHIAGDVTYKKDRDYELTNDQNSDEDGNEYYNDEYPIGDGQFIEGNRFRSNDLSSRFRHGMPQRTEAIKLGSCTDKFGHLVYGGQNPSNRYYTSAFYPNRSRPLLPHTHGDIGDCNARSCIPRYYRKQESDATQLYRQECLFRQASRPKESMTYDGMKSFFDKNYDMNRRRKYNISSIPSYLNPDETKTSGGIATESKSSLLRGEEHPHQKLVESSKTTRKINQNAESNHCNAVRTVKLDANLTDEHLPGESTATILEKTSMQIEDSDPETDYRNHQYTQKVARECEYDRKDPESETEHSLGCESSTTEIRNQVFTDNKLCLKDETNPNKIKESARSAKSKISTISKKQFNDLADLERSKCNALSVIDDGLHRLESRNENTSTAKSEKSIHTYTRDPPVIDSEDKTLVRGLEIVRSDFMDKMFKECRGYHLENMKQEIKRMQYLDSLPEKWAKQTNSLNL